MAGDVEPPALAHLVDFAERPRAHDWSLRSALVRYAQPEPERVGRVLDVVRRVEWALRPHAKLLERSGPEVWDALQSGPGAAAGPHAEVVELLRVSAELDRLGDALAGWAVDRTGDDPGAAVDDVTAAAAARLDVLGVPREDRALRGGRR